MSPANASLYKLPCPTPDRPSSERRFHIQRLNDILHISIERGDFSRAKQAWSILARCKEFDWTEAWTLGLHVVHEKDDANSRRPQLNFLRALMLEQRREKASILEESILQSAAAGNYEEALDELEFYLPSLPYQDSALLHSYAGLLSLTLAVKNSSVGSQTIDAISFRQTQDYFSRATELNPENLLASTFLRRLHDRQSDSSRSAKGQLQASP